MSTIKDVILHLEKLAPPSLQESYDNSGLIVGDKSQKVTGVITCLDCIEAVVEEAIAKKCNLIVAHHPIVFRGLKSLTGKNYIERTILKAIKNDIAIYAIHTNLDNVMHGVNGVFADALQLQNQRILAPKSAILRKIVVYVPENDLDTVKNAMFATGGGTIGAYDECSYAVKGEATFRPGDETNPYIGSQGKRSTVVENRLEIVYPNYLERSIVEAMKTEHPYEEVAYDIFKIENESKQIGAGMIGELKEEVDTMTFLKSLKITMEASLVRYTHITTDKIKKVAICGGSGSFLLADAKRQGADIFITGDFKYHEFFDAENQIIIADIGHFESEHLTIRYLADSIRENFTTFAILLTQVNTNPINYL